MSSPIPPSPTRLRQIALVAGDLDQAQHLLTRVIGTEVIFSDPAVGQWGLKNILVPIGGDLIEVVSPFLPNTPASRHLSKRGDSGYMIIMQTHDARARRKHIEDNNIAKVIFSHELEDSICIQYHPKGIKGGVIPELGSHNPSSSHPEPLMEHLSPWHAAGPPSSYVTYVAGMEKYKDLHLLEVVLRLHPGDQDTGAAARQWEQIFGVSRGKQEGEIEFTNARMKFVAGGEGKSEGIMEICIGVEGEEMLDGIYERARREGLGIGEEDCIEMLGVRWRFLLLGKAESRMKARL